LLSRPQTQGGESLKGQQFADRQAHGSCSATAAGWRLLSRSGRYRPARRR
jgi:hypothetical protein